MKAAVVTVHDENYKILADLTWHKNRVLYAQKHGYDAIAKTEGFGTMIMGWEKIAILLEVMKQNKHDVLHWSGTDTMITNFHIPLSEFLYDGYHVTIATDFNGIQADSFVVRNTMEGRAWLQMIMDKQQEYSRHPFFEQGVMMETYQQYKNIVKVVPQRYLNSYHYPLYKNKGAKNNLDIMGFSGQWHKGDFLIHCPDHPMHVRLSLFNELLPEVIT
jgi:hypothetical protein